MPPVSRRSFLGAVFGLVASLALCGARPAGAVGRRLDLATMTERAGTIIRGRVVSLREGRHPQYHNIGVLYVTLQVDETLKGTANDRFTFMQFGGRAAAGDSEKSLSMAQSLPDLPVYRVGEEVVLFLYPPSRVGFTSPVGGAQGIFHVQGQPGQPTTVISEGGNRSLAVKGSLFTHLKSNQQDLLHDPGDTLDYKTFRATVKALKSGK